MKRTYLGSLLLICGLTAWSNASYSGNSDDAYWRDKQWMGKLLNAVHSALHYPTNTAGQPMQPVPETTQATVGFTYIDGKIRDTKIIKSSGRPDLDSAFLLEITTAHLPKAKGSQAAEPHQFKLVLKMNTPMQDFEAAICKAIYAKWLYPKDAILAGELASTTLEFKYYAGKASAIRLVQSGGNKLVDESLMQALANSQLPQPPAWLPSHPLTMQASLSSALGEWDLCALSQIRLR